MERHRQALKAQAISTEGLSLKVSGQCMLPVFDDGASLTFHARRLYIPGDILAVLHEDAVVRVHRLLFVAPRFRPSGLGFYALCCADDSERADLWCRVERILGRLSHVDGQPIPIRKTNDVVLALSTFASHIKRRIIKRP